MKAAWDSEAIQNLCQLCQLGVTQVCLAQSFEYTHLSRGAPVTLSGASRAQGAV